MTDLELYELECLLINKFELIDLSDTEYCEKTGLVIVKNKDFKELVNLFYVERYSINKEENIILSIHIFTILFLRFFRNNKTITFIKKIEL